MIDAEVVVVGAGIVGAAVARAAQERLGTGAVVVLDKEPAPARHQSGRNSGVVHSGIYYSPGSAKARLVADGRNRLERYCTERALPYSRCGKVVVATRSSELAALAELARRGRANGVELEPLSAAALTAVEPHVRGIAGLHVPSTAVTDFGAVARSLLAEVQAAGGALLYDREVTAVSVDGEAVTALTPAGPVRARRLINCAGLHSDRVARMAGARIDARIVAFRGEYDELAGEARALVRALVYPVPDPRWPFLGVHLTRGVDGSVHVGPNAVLALAREAYAGGVDPGYLCSLFAHPGLRVLARRYWRTGAVELLRSRSSRLLLAEVRRLVPEVGTDDLVPAPAGIRAQALSVDGRLLDDFAFAESPRCVHVVNAPSPAATASFAIADRILARLPR